MQYTIETNGQVECWGVYEVVLSSQATVANPYRDISLTAVFSSGLKKIEVTGFYDGNNTFKIRFSPDVVGPWSYKTHSDCADLDGKTGSFDCYSPSEDNHGPIVVHGQHFFYADGTPFYPMGTTAYVWHYQKEERIQQTLTSFSKYHFNKIRMLFFPKQYAGGPNDLHKVDYDPEYLPFKKEDGKLDFSKPNPDYYALYEKRVLQLMELGIQADVILFHVYDQGLWNIPQSMTEEDDAWYVQYIVARMSAFRNTWWSLANEYDLFGISLTISANGCKPKDWEKIGNQIQAIDPHQRLRSVHNLPWAPIYPNSPWVTHISYQHPNTWSLAIMLKNQTNKPVINDEYQYEGNVTNDYGNCSDALELKRHWMADLAGSYATHGEIYYWDENPDHLFWATGGTLQGGSPPKLKYLKQVMESVPYYEMKPDLALSDGVDFFCLGKGDDLLLYFFGPGFKDRPKFPLGHKLVSEDEYELEIHDVWNCHKICTVRAKGGGTYIRMPAFCVVIAKKIP